MTIKYFLKALYINTHQPDGNSMLVLAQGFVVQIIVNNMMVLWGMEEGGGGGVCVRNMWVTGEEQSGTTPMAFPVGTETQK